MNTGFPAALVWLVTQVSPGSPTQDGRKALLFDELDNGIQVVIEEKHAVPVVRVLAYMRIGSLYEGEYLGSGLSHYMEHIVAGGSTRRKVKTKDGDEIWIGRTEEENKKLVKSIGGYTNAKTFFNYTQYFISTKSEMVETAIDLISDYLQNCQFDPGEVAREQGVVQQELLRNLDNVGRLRQQTFTETMFKKHPIRVPIIGYRDCIQRITRENMLRFYKKHYTPQNCVVSIVGDIDKHEILKLVKRYFSGWKRKSLEPYQIPQEPEQDAMRWVEEQHGSTKTCLVAMGFPTIPLRHPDLYKLDMLSNVLGSSASARLPRKFEHDPARKNVATGLRTGNWTPVFGAGRLACYFSSDTVENTRTLVREIWEEMGRLKEELVTDGEIARALKVLEKQFHQGRASIENRAEELASNLAAGLDPLFNDQYLERMKKVTPEEIRDAAIKYLHEDKLNVVIITPPKAEASVAPSERGPVVDDVTKVELGNGLTLLLKKLPGYGMVDVVAAFNGGVIYEDEKTNGLFFLMGNTFWRGTKSRPFPELIREMDRLGMELGAESHNNVYFVKMKCLASDLEASFGIFSDVLLNPSIDPQWVERLKMILLSRVLPNLEVKADGMMQKVLRNKLYTISPYRRQRYGTMETIRSFTVDDVRQCHESFTRPNNCVLAVYGDIDIEAAEKLVREAFAGWEKREIPGSKVAKDPGLHESKVISLTNEQVRTNFRIAWRAFSRQEEEDRVAFALMNSIIGASGWLHSRLREGDNEYVYSVLSRAYQGDMAGHFFIDTDFSPEDEEAVLGIIDGVVADIRAGLFSDEELKLSKKMIMSYDALGKQENDAVTQDQALSELFGQGHDYSKKYYERIKSVTREDVVRVAEKVFSGPSLRIFVRPRGGLEPGGGPSRK